MFTGPRSRGAAAVILAATLLAGCAGYQLGPTGGRTAGAVSIQVNPFFNKTIEPRLSEAVTASLRKHLQQDGTYRLSTHADGDIIVTGTILEYDRTGLSYQPTDVITPRDFWLRVTAQIVARERNTGRVVLDRKVSGRTTARLINDLPSTERQALPLLADDLARRATSLLVDGEW